MATLEDILAANPWLNTPTSRQGAGANLGSIQSALGQAAQQLATPEASRLGGVLNPRPMGPIVHAMGPIQFAGELGPAPNVVSYLTSGPSSPYRMASTTGPFRMNPGLGGALGGMGAGTAGSAGATGGVAGGIPGPAANTINAGAGASGRASGLLSSLKGAPGHIKSLGLKGGLKAAGKASIPATIGLTLSGMGNALPGDDQPYEQAIQGALAGGGIGAGVGSIIPGVGTAVGGGIGAVIGGIGGLLSSALGKDKKKSDVTNTLPQILATSGLPASEQQNLTAMYNLLNQLGGNTKESAQTALQTVGQLAVERLNEQQQQKQDLAYAAATQSITAQYLAPYQQRILDSAAMQAQLTMRNAQNLPPEYKLVAENQAQQQLALAQGAAGAYAAQISAAPSIALLRKQQSQVEQAAGSLYSQALGQIMSPQAQQLDLANLGG